MGVTTFHIKDAKKIIGLKSMAYKDYLAARRLLLTDMLHQAAFFMATSIEKEFKAYLWTRGKTVNIQHDVFKLYTMVKQVAPEVVKELNPEFLRAITKMYESRYYEKLSPGYNFVIIKNKFLTELDFTFSILDPLLRISNVKDTTIPPSAYERDQTYNNPSLLEKNYVLNKEIKKDVLSKEDLVYEFRVIFNHEILETLYTIPRNLDEKTFIYEGLKAVDPTKSYVMSHVFPNENGLIYFSRSGVILSGTIT